MNGGVGIILDLLESVREKLKVAYNAKYLN